MDIGQIGSTAKSGTWVDSHPTSVAGSGNAATRPAQSPSPALTSSAVQQPDAAPSAGQVGQALQSINKALQALSSNLEFTVDTDTNRTIVKVVDQQTKEVIRQMPTVEALEIAKAMDRLQGLLIRQKA